MSDQERIKLQNRFRILKYLQNARRCTKQEIGNELGLSIPTVTNNLNELQDQNIVIPEGQGESSGGRRPVVYCFNPAGLLSLGIDITPHGIKSILVDMDGKQQKSFSSQTVPHSKEEIYSAVKTLYGQALEYVFEKDTSLSGVGISLPGVVNVEEKRLVTAPNLHLSDISFLELEKELAADVVIENEANAAATAEKILCHEEGISDILYLSITEGVGAGIYLENTLYRGRRNKAGEIGHICLIPGGRDCNCGQRGCLEQYVSEQALLDTYNQMSHASVPHLHSFFSQIDAGDTIAEKALERYTNYLAMGIQNLLHMFDPSAVIVGGNLSLYPNYILPQLKERLFSKEGLQFHSDVVIKCSDLGSDASVVGAAILNYEHFHI